jgi:hypothetical protein
LINVRRVVQTMIAAKGSDGRPFIERFHGFCNAVSNTVGSVTFAMSENNVGGSRVVPNLKPANYVGTTDVAIVEDLLYNMPEDERPQIRVGQWDEGSKSWRYAMEPLQPKHIYIMKVDVEGYDVAALNGLKRLLTESPPVALVSEFHPDSAFGVHCDPLKFVRFMYGAGYRYQHEERWFQGRTLKSVEEMLSHVNASMAGTEGYPRTFEGWWDLDS